MVRDLVVFSRKSGNVADRPRRIVSQHTHVDRDNPLVFYQLEGLEGSLFIAESLQHHVSPMEPSSGQVQ